MATNGKSGFWNDWKTQHPRWHRLLVLELASIAGLLVVGLIWLFAADIWLFWSENRDGLRDLGLTLVAVIGLPLLIWRERTGHRTANIAAERHEKQTEADRERRVTDSFTKAVELLGKPELEVRLGAIYALERIAHESKRDHWPIMETLTAYVRTKSPAQFKAQDASQSSQGHSSDKAVSAYAVAAAEGTTEAEQGTAQTSLTELAVDIQAVLTVLTRRTLEHEEKNQRINLSEANLSGADLSEANLREANLRGADLGGANLREANLMAADLNGANLSRAYLREVNLIWAKLSGADLSGANLSGANLSNAYLGRADLSWANLSGANLSRANLSEAHLGRAHLGRANLGRADLSRAYLGRADLSRAYLRGANLSRADLSEANLSEADLREADLSKADLREANLIGADLSRANLSEADLSGAKFCQTTMPDGTVNNRDCPPEPAAPIPSETPPTSD